MDLNTPHDTADYTKQFLLPVMLSVKLYSVLGDYSLLGTYCRVNNGQETLEHQL